MGAHYAELRQRAELLALGLLTAVCFAPVAGCVYFMWGMS